jgi:hypothetical protein
MAYLIVFSSISSFSTLVLLSARISFQYWSLSGMGESYACSKTTLAIPDMTMSFAQVIQGSRVQ